MRLDYFNALPHPTGKDKAVKDSDDEARASSLLPLEGVGKVKTGRAISWRGSELTTESVASSGNYSHFMTDSVQVQATKRHVLSQFLANWQTL